jgi:hypothetical protein
MKSNQNDFRNSPKLLTFIFWFDQAVTFADDIRDRIKLSASH